MKKILLLFCALFVFGIGSAVAQDPVVSITTKIANQGSYVTGYDKEFKLIDPGSDRSWTVKNFNNNNSAWDNIRCGSKSSATTATITTDFAIGSPITKVAVEISRYKTGASQKMTSMKLLVSANADMSNSTSYDADISTLPATTGTPVTITIPVADPEEDMYYQLSIDMPKVSSEGVFSVNELKYYTYDPEQKPGVHSALLDFTDKDAILDAYVGDGTIKSGSEYSETGTNNLDGASFVVGDVCVSLSKAEGTIQPRWWESSTISPELRLNPNNIMTIVLNKRSYRLMEVKFLQGNANASYYDSLGATIDTNLGESELINKTWNAPETGNVDRMTLMFKDYCRCGSIRIIYYDEEEGTVGIDAVPIDNEESNEPIEYISLQGLKVLGNSITPGIYIVRQGSKVKKVIVK